MGARAFFDSNVLLYALSSETSKADIAEELLRARGVISVQVLNEVAFVAHRKLRMSWSEINEALAIIRQSCELPASVTIDTHQSAIALAERYGYTLFDCLLLASALEQNCDTFYSEDMQDGHRIGELTIRNPFGQIR